MNAKMAAKAKRELAEAEAYERERDRREAAERDAADARALFGNGETSVGSGEQGVYVQYSGSAGYRGPSISSGRRRPAAGQGSGRIDRRNKVNGGAGRGRRR
jgi:membrane protein involved in colicin uptake